MLNTLTFRIPRPPAAALGSAPAPAFLLWPQETFLPLPPYFSPSHTGMACTDYDRLGQQYEAAVRVWTELTNPETVAIPGRQNTAQLKLEALARLTNVADLLYLHRRWCPDCKKGDVGLIDLSD